MAGESSLNGAAAGRWALEHDGRLLEAETGRAGRRRVLRVYADGEPAGDAAGFNTVTVPFGDAAVRAVFDLVGLVDGQAARCELVRDDRDREAEADGPEGDDPGGDRDGGDDGRDRAGVPFAPPEGSRAARREELARAHPVLYASRHVVLAAGKVLFPLLGLGVLVRMLVEMVPWPHVDPPEVSLPDVPWPDVPWPDVDLPDVSAPWWLQAVVASAEFWGPLLVAVGVAAREVSRRKRRRAAEPAERDEQDGTSGTPIARGAATGGRTTGVPATGRGRAARRGRGAAAGSQVPRAAATAGP
ncbi:hypothetical protein ACFHW2_23270 [Actinomadura sp. LOL_016]|uniref:hypothetical protein n=1 Tax=unclassified Actinomadura TaxID=2626254 RepID=UPI003A800348